MATNEPLSVSQIAVALGMPEKTLRRGVSEETLRSSSNPLSVSQIARVFEIPEATLRFFAHGHGYEYPDFMYYVLGFINSNEKIKAKANKLVEAEIASWESLQECWIYNFFHSYQNGHGGSNPAAWYTAVRIGLSKLAPLPQTFTPP